MLTDLQCRNATSGDKTIKKLSDGGGLYLWVNAAGRKYWRFRYKIAKKEQSLSLGVYPDVGLLEARKKAREQKSILDKGADPAQTRKIVRIERKVALSNTFETVALEWYSKQRLTWVDKHASDVLRRLKFNLFPRLGNRPISEITGPELLDAIYVIEKRKAFDLSHRVLAMAGQVFRYGIATGRCNYDVASGLSAALTVAPRKNQPAIKPKQLPRLLISMDQDSGGQSSKLAMKVIAHTFLRTGEMIYGHWSEIDFEARIWSIPKERMKMKNDHLVRLSTQVLGYLRELKILAGNSSFIFPGRDPSKSISNGTILRALERMGYRNQMTGHGFRSVASTVLNETGFKSDVIERQLAHCERNEVRGAYNRAEYIKDRIYMMQWWSDYLEAITYNRVPSPPKESALR